MGFEHTTAPKVSSYQKKDGSMVSRPLEDMAPFKAESFVEALCS